MPSQKPQLSRAVLLPSNDIYVRFDDCSLIHLNPSAGSYVLHGANGTTTNRGLCATATSFIAERLRLALHLRNTLTSAAPRVFWDLLPPSFRYFDLDDDSGLGRGPTRGRAVGRPARHADGAIRVLSLDRRAWLLLHPERHTFCVCFPQCAGPVDDMPAGTLVRLRAAAVLEAYGSDMPPDGAADVSKKEVQRYVFCTQVHSVTVDARRMQHALVRPCADDPDALTTPSEEIGWVATSVTPTAVTRRRVGRDVAGRARTSRRFL